MNACELPMMFFNGLCSSTGRNCGHLNCRVASLSSNACQCPRLKKEGKSSRPFCRWHSYPRRYPPCRGGIGSAGLYFLFLPWAEISDGLDQLLYLGKPALQKRELEFQPLQAQLVNADSFLPGLVFNLLGNANHSSGGDLSRKIASL